MQICRLSPNHPSATQTAGYTATVMRGFVGERWIGWRMFGQANYEPDTSNQYLETYLLMNKTEYQDCIFISKIDFNAQDSYEYSKSACRTVEE